MSTLTALAILSEVVFSPAIPTFHCTEVQREVGKPVVLECSQPTGESKIQATRTPASEERPLDTTSQQIDGEKIWEAITALERAQTAEQATELKQRPPDALSAEQRELRQLLRKAPELIETLKALPRQEVVTVTDPVLQKAAADALQAQTLLEKQFGREVLDFGIALGLLLAFLALVGVVFLGRKIKRVFTFVSDQLSILGERVRILTGRVDTIEDRFVVSITKRTGEEFRTLRPEEIRALEPGAEFDYFIDVEGKIARYRVKVVDRTENRKDVSLIIPQLGLRAKSKTLHGVLAGSIDQNGGMHPFVALEVAA